MLGGLYLFATRYDPQPAIAPTPVRAVPAVDAATLTRKARVILVTLDGARWQQVLDPDGPLKHTLAAARANGAILPGRISGRIALSLPGYQAIALGHATDCEANTCPRVTEETVSEALARQLPGKVATFGSWARLQRSATARDGSVHVDLPEEGPNGGVRWENARLDAVTAPRALAYWVAERPRFLHLALLDMDELAHARDGDGVTAALAAADVTIGRLLAEIAALPADERALTTVLVTTDHGRGWGPMSFDHSPFGASRTLFLLAIGDPVRGGGGAFTQAQLRPTIERLFGLCAPGAIPAIVDPACP